MNDMPQVKSMPVDELVALLKRMPSDVLNQAAEIITFTRNDRDDLQSQLTQSNELASTLKSQWLSMSTQLTQAVRDRDDAIREANRRDQKWMDGINETLGQKLDYGDPCSRDNASKALGQFAQQLTQAHKERDEAVAACAVMREALQHVYNWKMYLHTKVIDAGVLKQIEQALSTTCGRDLLERIKALEDENARLRRDLMDSPTDIQELVIKKLNLVSAEGPTKAEARIKALEGELKCKETEWAKIFSDLKSKATTEVALATPLIEKGRK